MKKPNYLLIVIFFTVMAFGQNGINHQEESQENIERTIFDQKELKLPNPIEGNFANIESHSEEGVKNLFHYDLFLGSFVPTQNAKLLGVKPSLGLSAGVNHGNMTYDLTLEIRLGSTNEEYQLADTYMTSHYLGGYVGVDFLGEVLADQKNGFLLLGGLGLDIFEIEPPVYDDPSWVEYLIFGDEATLVTESKNILSLNINFGCMYRYYFKPGKYLGLKYRFNIVDYNSKKVLTNLTGNFHSISLSFGGLLDDSL